MPIFKPSNSAPDRDPKVEIGEGFQLLREVRDRNIYPELVSPRGTVEGNVRRLRDRRQRRGRLRSGWPGHLRVPGHPERYLLARPGREGEGEGEISRRADAFRRVPFKDLGTIAPPLTGRGYRIEYFDDGSNLVHVLGGYDDAA